MRYSAQNLTYEAAGVNINAGNALVEKIKPIAAKTHRPGVLAGLGGFGALFELPIHRFTQPIIVSSTDGVGTKLQLAHSLQKHHTIGIDLVAMCVNDIIVQGAEPLFFLDYFASGHLDLAIATQVMQGIGYGCEQAGVALVGGETAEMPGLYQGQDYDLAGFAVGLVEKSQLLGSSKVQLEDAVIGIASSGVHANGFSLIRKILSLTQIPLDTPFDGSTLGECLLRPTHIYIKSLLTLLKKVEVHALAHITGGGLLENIPRILPAFTQAYIDSTKWTKQAVFEWIQQQGNISIIEMYRTFNCGIGMIVCVPAQAVADTLNCLRQSGETAWHIGYIKPHPEKTPKVIIDANLQL